MSQSTRPLILTLSLSCAICFLRTKNPVSCRNGHVFCSSCISSWKASSKSQASEKCPTCREEGEMLTLIGGSTPECEPEVDFAKENVGEELESVRRLRRTRMEVLLGHYESENVAWERINGKLARELEEAKKKIGELESELFSRPARPELPVASASPATSATVVDQELTTPKKSVPVKLRFRPDFFGPPAKRMRLDVNETEEQTDSANCGHSDLITALEAEIERLEAENSRLRTQAPPTPSKWPGHELSSAKARIKELEKELEAARRALDVQDEYAERLSRRVAELEAR